MPIITALGGGSAKGLGFGGGKNPPVSFDYLVVAGGGHGADNNDGTGGGGAGGLRTSFPGGTQIELDSGNYTITVGAGGSPSTPGVLGYSAAPVSSNFDYTNGNPSTFSNITATGGGKGGNINVVNAESGGSGGGGGSNYNSGSQPSGSGNAGSYSPSEGNPGGAGDGLSRNDLGFGGGGGGGHAGAGTAGGPGGTGGPGGSGTASNITGSPVNYAGGGGGGVYNGGNPYAPPGIGGTGGVGGGGQAAPTTGVRAFVPGGTPGFAAQANTGGGGAGTCYQQSVINDVTPAANQPYGYAGGSGIVVLRAPSGSKFKVTPGTNTITTDGPTGDKIATFNVSGTLTI
jgi:hypothetical protein